MPALSVVPIVVDGAKAFAIAANDNALLTLVPPALDPLIVAGGAAAGVSLGTVVTAFAAGGLIGQALWDYTHPGQERLFTFNVPGGGSSVAMPDGGYLGPGWHISRDCGPHYGFWTNVYSAGCGVSPLGVADYVAVPENPAWNIDVPGPAGPISTVEFVSHAGPFDQMRWGVSYERDAGVSPLVVPNPVPAVRVLPDRWIDPNVERRFPWINPVVPDQPDIVADPFPGDEPVIRHELAIDPVGRHARTITVVSPADTPAPPPSGTKESKTKSSHPLSLRILHDANQWADRIDAIYGTLPLDVRMRWSRGRETKGSSFRSVTNVADAEWKLEAIWYNWHRLDAAEAVAAVIRNEIEDELYKPFFRARSDVRSGRLVQRLLRNRR